MEDFTQYPLSSECGVLLVDVQGCPGNPVMGSNTKARMSKSAIIRHQSSSSTSN